MSIDWLGWLLSVVSLAVAVVFAVRAARRSGDRPADAAHALMGLGMAGMFAPPGDPVPAQLGLVVFVVIAAWFGARLLRGRRPGDGGATHLVVAPAAMAFMYLGMAGGSDGSAPDAGSGGGHAGHAGGAVPGSAGAALLAVLSLLLAAYFIWHAWHSLGARPGPVPVGADGGPGRGDGPASTATAARVATTTRAEPAAHALMSGLMAVMFLLAV